MAHDIILTYSEDIPFLKICGQCYRATAAFEFLSKNEIDLIFLDIRMPKLNGLDFLRTLQQKPLVIITSAYEEYALESFDLAVCDYLLKPFRFDRFLKAANRALENYNLKNQSHQPTALSQFDEAEEEQGQIAIKADKKHILIKINEIQYLESLGNYVKVWKDKEYLLAQRTMASFETQLPSTFIRIHKSYLLNKQFVHFLEGNMIHLRNGKQLPVGKNFRASIKEALDMQE